MVQNTEKHQLATYYRKRGFSYNEIAKIVGVSKGTLSNWFSAQSFSQTVTAQNQDKARKDNQKRMQILNKLKQNERGRLYKETAKAAKTEYSHYKSNPLFIAGLMLYLGEGDTKNPNLLRLASTNIEVHRIFMKFLMNYLGIPKSRLRFWLLFYPDLAEQVCLNKWSKALKLPKNQFYKTQVIKNQSKNKTLQYGVGNIIISDAVLKCKLDTWLTLVQKELTK